MANDESTMKFSVPEVAALVVLMAEAREVSNPELAEIAGFTLTGKERVRLVKAGLIESRKVGRSFAHELTERGWRECRNLSEGDRPTRAGSAGGALFVLLAGLHRSLDQRRISHADFFSRAAGPVGAVPVAADDVESRVHAAYRSLANEPAGWVSLTDLRAALADDSRPSVDAALRRMIRTPGVHLIPVANLKSLTPRDREAAITIGGEDNHALSVEEA